MAEREANTSKRVDVDGVKAVLVETLGLEDRADSIDPETALFGSLPELDSLAVVELIVALEERYGIAVEGEDVTAEAFATLASLTAFVEERSGEDSSRSDLTARLLSPAAFIASSSPGLVELVSI